MWRTGVIDTVTSNLSYNYTVIRYTFDLLIIRGSKKSKFSLLEMLPFQLLSFVIVLSQTKTSRSYKTKDIETKQKIVQLEKD